MFRRNAIIWTIRELNDDMIILCHWYHTHEHGTLQPETRRNQIANYLLTLWDLKSCWIIFSVNLFFENRVQKRRWIERIDLGLCLIILALNGFVSVLSAFLIMVERRFQIRWEFSTRVLIAPHSQIPFAEYKCRTIIIDPFRLDCVELKKLTFTIERFTFFFASCAFQMLLTSFDFFRWFPILSQQMSSDVIRETKLQRILASQEWWKKYQFYTRLPLPGSISIECVRVWQMHAKYKARQSEKSWCKSKYKSCAFYSDALCQSTFGNLVNWIILPMWSGYVRSRLDLLSSGTVGNGRENIVVAELHSILCSCSANIR